MEEIIAPILAWMLPTMDLQSQQSAEALDYPPPPVARMTPDEAQAVIRLWQQEQADSGGLTNRPTLADLAEGLEIAPEDARRLLAQVRRPQPGADSQEARIAREHRKLARRLAWGTAVAALGAWLLHFL